MALPKVLANCMQSCEHKLRAEVEQSKWDRGELLLLLACCHLATSQSQTGCDWLAGIAQCTLSAWKMEAGWVCRTDISCDATMGKDTATQTETNTCIQAVLSHRQQPCCNWFATANSL
jgi:hypothetical protein